MSILIKGMEMPTDCQLCPMAHWNKLDQLTGCDVVSGKRYVPKEDYAYWHGQRADWCPLVEVPKHGRLIDADALTELVETEFRNWGEDYDASQFLGDIEDAPTIIEAEE